MRVASWLPGASPLTASTNCSSRSVMARTRVSPHTGHAGDADPFGGFQVWPSEQRKPPAILEPRRSGHHPAIIPALAPDSSTRTQPSNFCADRHGMIALYRTNESKKIAFLCDVFRLEVTLIKCPTGLLQRSTLRRGVLRARCRHSCGKLGCKAFLGNILRPCDLGGACQGRYSRCGGAEKVLRCRAPETIRKEPHAQLDWCADGEWRIGPGRESWVLSERMPP